MPPNVLERTVTRTLRRPPTIRGAGSVIVVTTLSTVLVSGFVMRFFDHSEFSSLGISLWWALQTVTTVGYGDIVPENTIGRLVGAVVMLEGIAFLTIVTAVITSTFIERARRESLLSDESGAGQLLEKMRSIDERLQRIEQQLGEPRR